MDVTVPAAFIDGTAGIHELPLGPALLRAADWFNDAFVEALAMRGWPRLNRSQAQLLLQVDPEGTHPAELARRLQMTRQSMHQLLRTMEEHELVVQEPHPQDGRALLVKLTSKAHLLGFHAGQLQLELDEELARRIGPDRLAALKTILAADWGPPPVR
jgi:DNA-binding MarR family transcriptional regulator